MDKLIVYVVEEECIDPFFEPHIVEIFSTEEKAKEFINSKPEGWERNQFNINEWEVK